MEYVLITPARNEEACIEKTIQSVVAQTKQPLRWVIVDDGSTDHTGAIVTSYTGQYPWIRLVQRPRHVDRSFAAKVQAFHAGYQSLDDIDYDVIGNLDADISFDPDYLEFLMENFAADANLGVAGTTFLENGYDSARDSFEGQNHVAGGCQLFRRQCFEGIGGYIPNRAGGIDWIAVTTARMQGWKTQSFKEKCFFHHRTLGTAERGAIAAMFSYGEKDYYLGGHPVWQLFRVVYRLTKKPVVFGGLALLAGYSSAALRRMKRPVSPELMRFHRREQMAKLARILRSMLRLKKVDNFRLTGEGPTSRESIKKGI